MAKPSRGRGSSRSNSSSRSRSCSRSFSGSDSRSASSRSRSRSRSVSSSSFRSRSPSRSPPPPLKSSAEPSRQPHSPLRLVKNASPPSLSICGQTSCTTTITQNKGNFGEVLNVKLAMDRIVNLPKGYGYVEFKTRTDAEKAHLYMNGAQIDGDIVTAKFTLPPWEKVSPAKVVPLKRDVAKSDGAEVGKDEPKRNREVSPSPRRSPIGCRGGSPGRMDPPTHRRVDSPIRHRDSPIR